MKKYAGLLIILAGACWGSIGMFVRHLTEYGLDTLNIVEMRSILASLIIGMMILAKDKSMFKVKLKNLWPLIGAGVIGMMFFNYCYMNTIRATSLSVAAVLMYTAPIFVVFFSALLFGEKITRSKLFALAMIFGGCCMVSGLFDGTAVLSAKGLFIGLCAGFGYAMNTIFQRYALNYGYQPLAIQFYTFVFASLSGLFICDLNVTVNAAQSAGLLFILWLIAIAVIATVAPNVLYGTGLKYLENGKTAMLASVEPIMASVFGIILFHEVPSIIAFVGMAIMFTGIYLVNRS